MAALPPATPRYVAHYQAMGEPNGGDYMAFLAPFAAGSADQPAALRDRVLDAADDFPKVFLVLQRDAAGLPPTIRTIHRPFRYAPSMTTASPWDNGVFGLLGDLGAGNQTTIIRWPNAPFTRTAQAVVPTTDVVTAAWGIAPLLAEGLGPYAASDQDTEAVVTRGIVPVPQRYVHLVLGRAMTPRQLWVEVIETIRADGKLAECQPLVDWARVASTLTGGESLLVLVPEPLTTPLADDALRARTWDKVTYYLPGLLAGGGATQIALQHSSAIRDILYNRARTPPRQGRQAAPQRPFRDGSRSRLMACSAYARSPTRQICPCFGPAS
jgi:hypothetical protein